MVNIEDIQIGAEVRFLDSVGGGRVARVDAGKRLVWVEDEDGFEIPTQLSQIVPLQHGGLSSKQAPSGVQHSSHTVQSTQAGPSDIQAKAAGSGIPAAIERRAKAKREPKREDILEVDLHLNAILSGSEVFQTTHLSTFESGAGASHGEILRLQMDVFRRVLRENLRNRGKKIVFIHGRGAGILKAAIASELRQHYSTCEWQDASFAQYGFGATMVIIR